MHHGGGDGPPPFLRKGAPAMAIMRGNNAVSGKLVTDNMARDIEGKDMGKVAKTDPMTPKMTGMADNYNYGAKSGQ